MQHAIATDRELFALKPLDVRYERAITKARGLSVLVFPNGLKTFALRYVAPNGARRRLSLGDYPGLSLADARLKAGGVRVEIAEGKDPAAERAEARREARMGETLEDLAEGYWKAATLGLHGGLKRPLRPETIERQKSLWAKYVKPALGSRPFRELRRADIRSFMTGFVTQGALSPASIIAIGDVLRALFVYALHNDLIEFSPAAGLTRPVTAQSRTRMFSDKGLGRIVAALEDASGAEEGREDPYAKLAPHMALALMFLTLTLTRRTECAGGRWLEIDRTRRIWTIPAERTKNGRIHVVPLSPQALRVLDLAATLPGRTEDGFLFPSGGVMAHVDPRGMTRAIQRLCEKYGLPKGSPHDIRRTGATTLTGEEYGIRQFIVGKVLAHTTNEGATVTAVYDRNEYLAEKRTALEAWGRHVDGLPRPGSDDQPENGKRPHLRLVVAA